MVYRGYGIPQDNLKNLNEASIQTDVPHPGLLIDPGADLGEQDARVRVFFRDVEKQLCELLADDRYPVVLGCVAWLTNQTILEALAKKDGVAILVQKEDFLRPDTGQTEGWKARLQQRYERITPLIRYQLPGLVSQASVASDPEIGIRCVGVSPRDRGLTRPNMHHKFIVLCEGEANGIVVPRVVWTGSFNFSANSTNSIENAVTIESDTVALAYAHEFGQLALLSEPLDWESEWVAPEWRIGT